jgi:acetyl esterase/lipase
MTSAVFYVHGGGYVTGSVESLRKQIEARVEATGVPFFAPGYRLAPEHPHPIPHEDCFAALKWVHENAADMFGVDKSRLGVFGESAGGGLAAGLALRARDEKLSPPLAKQILVYPMMDDRNTILNPEVEHFFTWSHDNNETAWKTLIGDKEGEIDCYGAAARATNLRGLPSTYLDVGSLDIFVHDSLDYAQRLMQENVEVELHVWPRVPHSSEGLAPQTRYGKMAVDSRDDAVKSL